MLENCTLLITGKISHGRDVGKNPPERKFIYAACDNCGKQRWVAYTEWIHGENHLCQSCAAKKREPPHRKGEKHWNWKTGRYISRGQYKGYVMVWVDPQSFFGCMVNPKRPYLPEHRLVMAQFLKRPLAKWELVHHKNGIRTDNRIENLELTTNGNHIIEHNKGYKDGYQQGYYDGHYKRIKELKARIEELECQLQI